MNALAYLFSSKPIPDDPIPEESNPVKVVRASSNLRMPTIAFSAPRSKVQLKLSIQRLRLLSSKKAQLAKVLSPHLKLRY